MQSKIRKSIYNYIRKLPYYIKEGSLPYEQASPSLDLDNFHVVREESFPEDDMEPKRDIEMVLCRVQGEEIEVISFEKYRRKPEHRYEVRMYVLSPLDFLTEELEPGPLLRKGMTDSGKIFLKEELGSFSPSRQEAALERAAEIYFKSCLGRIREASPSPPLIEEIFLYADYEEEGLTSLQQNELTRTLPLPKEVIQWEGASSVVRRYCLERFGLDLYKTSCGADI